MRGPNTSRVQRAIARATELHLDASNGPPTEFRIFPKGTFTTRNHPDVTFVFDEESARSVMEAARVWGNQFHADYEHAALDPGERGSPAAAWFDLAVRDDGLWAVNVKWTEHAQKAISSREYRYHSPVWKFDERTGRVLEFINLALTNLPATDHMVPIAASLTSPSLESKPMKTVLAALKLADSATEAEALAALSRVQELQTSVANLTGTATPAEMVGTLQAFKASHEALAATRQELDTLKAEKEKGELEKVLDEGVKAGKLTAAMLEWARKQPVAELKAYLAVAHRVIPTKANPPKGSDAGGTTTENATVEATDGDRYMANLTGTDIKLIAASRARHGGRVPRGDWLGDKASHDASALSE